MTGEQDGSFNTVTASSTAPAVITESMQRLLQVRDLSNCSQKDQFEIGRLSTKNSVNVSVTVVEAIVMASINGSAKQVSRKHLRIAASPSTKSPSVNERKMTPRTNPFQMERLLPSSKALPKH